MVDAIFEIYRTPELRVAFVPVLERIAVALGAELIVTIARTQPE